MEVDGEGGRWLLEKRKRRRKFGCGHNGRHAAGSAASGEGGNAKKVRLARDAEFLSQLIHNINFTFFTSNELGVANSASDTHAARDDTQAY